MYIIIHVMYFHVHAYNVQCTCIWHEISTLQLSVSNTQYLLYMRRYVLFHKRFGGGGGITVKYHWDTTTMINCKWQRILNQEKMTTFQDPMMTVDKSITCSCCKKEQLPKDFILIFPPCGLINVNNSCFIE